ncbi:hypothetical protein KUV46_15640 [Thalassovita mediterranea]|nr:hypothetical protein KUV46_15640 [Thalassovita mediterranea]
MGTVTLQSSLTDPSARLVVPWDKTFLEFVEEYFPDPEKLNSMSHLTVDMGTGETVDFGEAWLEPVGDRHLTMQLMPAGVDPLTAAIIVVASVALSVAATFLLQPKAPSQFGEDAAQSVYSVTAQANRAKLGGVIPEQFGTWERTPEYASQSYRLFDGNQEIRYFLLCLGAGDHDNIDIRIGDTPVSDLPAGIVESAVYKPADHTSELGVIDADFGIHENVVTSGEVDQLELETERAFTDTVNGTISGTTITFNELWAESNAAAGDTIEILSPFTATKIIASVTSGGMSVTTAFSSSATDEDIEFVIRRTSGLGRGPFVANRAGTETQKIELDVEWPGGLFKQKDNGNFADLTVELTATVQEIDDAGDDVGSPTTHVFEETGSSNDPIRRSYVITKPAGRYKVSLSRTDDQEVKARDSDRTIWTGLKAYLTYDTEAAVYGNVTLVALKITGAQEISSSSRSRIFVKSTRTITDLDGDPVTGGNLADVMKYIYCTQVGRPESEIEVYDAESNPAAYKLFQTAQASRSGFNGLFDTVGTVWTALEAVAALGRARPYPKAMTLSLVVDEAKDRRANVTPLNVIRGTMKAQYNWIEPSGYDGVVIEYNDATTFERKTVSWPLSEDNLENPKQQPVIGLTDDDEALSMAKYIWRQITLQNLELSWAMELAGRNFKPFDRLGLVWPDFNWADAAQVMAVSGSALTLNKVAPAGALYVQLTGTDGLCSAVLTATGDGSKTITLGAAPPFTIEVDGSKVRTACVFGLASDFPVKDVKVQRIRASKNRTTIEAVNYTEALFTDLV